jgi:UDPglucose 6-dehydrogenase
VSALVKTAEDAGYDLGMLRTVMTVNDEQRERIVDKIERACDGSLEGKTVAIWGVAAKAGTDNLSDSSSVDIAQRLTKRGARVRAYDPVAGEGAAALDLDVTTDAYECCTGAHALAVLTDWDVFRVLDFDRVKDELATPAIVDARNLLDAEQLRALGFTYEGVGRR